MSFFPNVDFCLGGSQPECVSKHSHVPTYFGIQYNHEGKLRVRINNGKKWNIDGPHVFITHPDSHFEYGSINREPRHHMFICLQGERIQSYIQNNFLPLNDDNPIIKINFPEKFYKTMNELIQAMKLNNLSYDRMVLMLEDLILQLHEQDDFKKKLPPWQLDHFEKLIEDINHDLQTDWDFNKEAANMNITATHFRRLFKQISGQPPRQYLLHQRLYKAAEYLIQSSDPVSHVAEKVGFDDHFYFSRAFKQKYSISPLAYRKEFTGS